MTRQAAKRRWSFSRVTLIAGGLAVAGFLLTRITWWFLLLTAVGTFGPGLLREVGWLGDKDEFQRHSDHRAGYHAYLVVGLVAFFFVAYFRTGGSYGGEETVATLFLILAWFAWFLSSLIDYWGPANAARRILIVFGVVWLVFAILANTGSEWTGWAALLLHPLLAAPFFVLAVLARRFPRISGLLLLGAAAFFIHFFGLFQPGGRSTGGVVEVLFVGPLLASGLALLVGSPESDEGHALPA